VYGFLFALHSGSILYHFRYKVRYWSKMAIIFVAPAFDDPVRGSPSEHKSLFHHKMVARKDK